MAEVAGSVAIVEAANAAPAGMSFVDAADSADPAAAIIDEVLTGAPETPAETPVEGEKPAEAKPAEVTPPTEAPPANDVEAARLRKGYAKLADERQKLVELQNAARADRAAAQSFAVKAQKHDELIASITNDPAAFLLAHGGEELVQKALQGFIAMEKPAAEREVARLRQELERDKVTAAQREQEQTAATWRNGIIEKVRGDERFDLVNSFELHGDVIGVITGYYEKHSQRDEKGNVTVPAILSWDVAAQAVEDTRAAKLEKSKRYGKRTPTAAGTPAKDAPSAKPAPASAKKAPTSLSSVPVAESPVHADDYPTDDLDERERQILASLV